jgi:hypothetical protein
MEVVAPPSGDWRDLDLIRLWHPNEPSAAAVLGISKDLAYDLGRTGDIPTIRLGRLVMVPVMGLRRMLGEVS